MLTIYKVFSLLFTVIVSVQLVQGQSVDFTTFCATTGKGRDKEGRQSSKEACAQTVQGLIPDVQSMVSTLITSPTDGSTVTAAQGFEVTFSTIHMVTGLLQNEKTDFHRFPQTLDPATGFIEGGNSIAIQQLKDGNSVPDAQSVSFFQILNTPGSGDAGGTTTYSVKVRKGAIKTTGLHRICTCAMSAAFAPVIMPVAQRGAQDDCVRVNVV